MSEDEKLMRAMAMAEVAVQDMAEAGLDAKHIAIGLASQVQAQVSLAMPTATTARLFLEALMS